MWTSGYYHESVWVHPWFKKKSTILESDVDNGAESACIEVADVWESLSFLLNFVANLLFKTVLKKRTGIQFLLPHCPVYACMVSGSVVSNSLQPVDCSPPGSSVHGILLQARIREWVAISSCSSVCAKDKSQFLCLWVFSKQTDRGPRSGLCVNTASHLSLSASSVTISDLLRQCCRLVAASV